MSKSNKHVFDNSTLRLPDNYQVKLDEVVDLAKRLFNKNLKSIILGGSGGKSEIIPLWSDLDIYIVLDKYDFNQVKQFMIIDNKNKSCDIHIGVTIYTLNEVKNNLIDSKTKVMIYEKEQLGLDPTLYGKNYFLRQSYLDIQQNDKNNLPSIVHTCRRNCISLCNNEISLSKNHIKKFVVLLKCILNINGIFSYGYLNVFNDFCNLCEEKNMFDKSILNFNIREVLKSEHKLSESTKQFLDINTFVFENIVKLIENKKEKNKKIISCMGVVVSELKGKKYVAVLKDINNCWVLPKGHLEKNETFIEAAIREVYEETNISLYKHSFITKIGEYGYFSDIEENEKKIKVYLFKIDKMEKIRPQISENFVDGKWLLLEEAIEMLTYNEQKDVLKKASLLV